MDRYGQKRDRVAIINLVAGKTREGRVIKTLLDKLEEIRIGCVAPTLVACGEDEAAVRGTIVDQPFGFFLDLFRRGAQHELERIDIALHANLIAVTFLDLGNVHIAARRLLERFHHVDVGLLANHFHYFA